MAMKVVLTGGGTAGHINPALSIASILKDREPDTQIEYIGTKDRLESKLVPKAGYPIHFIEVYGLRRSLSPKNLKTAWKTLTSVHACKKLLKEIKPDLVVGTGGYVCFPVCYAASKLHIPTALHESNAEPGFAVKMLKNSADVVFVNFSEAEVFLKNSKCRTVHSGMPVNHEFYTLNKQAAREKLGITAKYRILSFGGSLGASHLNREMLGFIRDYMKDHPHVSLIHSVGSRDFAEISKRFAESGLDQLSNVILSEYIYDMPLQMAAADVVICRSGASTLSELATMGRASVLIPSPNVTNNQQYKNAKVFADRGAAELIEDQNLSSGALIKAVDSILSNEGRLSEMERAAKTLAVENTENILYETLKDLVNSKKV
ncbi:MAG: undecaprenyldiphospho-muramoylpentapeptide beta-N-acetylglucosaminyltransferase [Eubacteriales bacterium]